MKNLDLSSLKNTLNAIKNSIVKYRVSLFVIIVASVFGILIMGISNKAATEPTEQQINEAINSVKVVEVDDEAIRVVQQLQDNNIYITTLFDPGRVDPFSD